MYMLKLVVVLLTIIILTRQIHKEVVNTYDTLFMRNKGITNSPYA